jgi:glycolate oxidase
MSRGNDARDLGRTGGAAGRSSPAAPVGQYPRCTPGDLAELRGICGAERVVSEGPVLEDCSHDEMPWVRGYPEVVVFPQDAGQVSGMLQFASARGIPVTPRGSGTGLCGGAVPVSGGIVLCLSRMNRMLETDRENLTATVEAGVLLLSIHEAAEAQGFLYAPDPGEKTATIGGNVGTNAGGMRAIKYGVTRDNIRGLEVVLPSGKVLELGGKHAKNSTGYSLMNLFIGSEGTLGVVTRVTLKLFPLPRQTLSLLVPFNSLGAAISAVPRVLATGILPQSIEFAEKGVIEAAERYLGKRFPHRGAPSYLLLRVDGNSQAEVTTAMDLAGDACLEAGASDVLIADSQERQAAIWDARAAFLAALKSGNEVDECDVVVPRNCVAELVEYAKEVSAKVGVRIESFGHAGDGNLHIYVLRDGMDKSEWDRKLPRAMDLLYEKGGELGGLVSGEHGIGLAKRKYMARSLASAELALMVKLKQVFDPGGILNPGKVV